MLIPTTCCHRELNVISVTPSFPFLTPPPHALRSLSINHYKAVNLKLLDTLPEFPCLGQNGTVFNFTYTLRQHFLAVFWFCVFLCSREIDSDGGGREEMWVIYFNFSSFLYLFAFRG